MSVTASSQALDGMYANRASAIALEALVQYDDIDFDETGLRLYDVVDPEALDRLFCHQEGSTPSVAFEVCDATVHVWQSNGEIRARVNEERD